MNENPMVTVVTVCYNCAASIERTILSVIGQSYRDVEYIVVDGGSNDGTVDVIRKYEKHIDKWVSEPDGGVYFGMNKGIAMAHGTWINFMNAGDSFCSDDVLAACFKDKTYGGDVALLCGDTVCVFPWASYFRKGQNDDGTLNFCHQSVFTRTCLLKAHPYDTAYRIIADNIWYQGMLHYGYKLEYVPVAVANYEGYAGISAKNGVMFYKELSRSRSIPQGMRWKLSVAKLRLKLWIKQMIPRVVRDKAWEKELDRTLMRLDK